MRKPWKVGRPALQRYLEAWAQDLMQTASKLYKAVKQLFHKTSSTLPVFRVFTLFTVSKSQVLSKSNADQMQPEALRRARSTTCSYRFPANKHGSTKKLHNGIAMYCMHQSASNLIACATLAVSMGKMWRINHLDILNGWGCLETYRVARSIFAHSCIYIVRTYAFKSTDNIDHEYQHNQKHTCTSNIKEILIQMQCILDVV